MSRHMLGTDAPGFPKFIISCPILSLKKFVHLPSSGTPIPKVIEQPEARISASS